MPRVSVVIPACNQARWLGECLRSVYAQTFADYEVVVIDDGSTDGTAEVADRLRSRGLRILRHDRRLGPAAARNAGILATSSPLIAFLDSDDRWHPRKLELQVALFRRPGTLFSFTDYDCIDQDGRVTCKELLRRSREFGERYSPRMAREGFELFFPRTSTVMLRRRLLDQVGLFDVCFKVLEDTDLWLRIFKRHGLVRMRFLGRALACYRRHPGQISCRKPKSAELLLDELYWEIKNARRGFAKAPPMRPSALIEIRRSQP